MAFQPKKQVYSGKIREVTLGTGNQAVTVGGRSAYAFHGFEGEMPHPPKVAMEVWEKDPSEDWCEAAKAPFADVLSDPAAWAKKCVDTYGAEIIVVQTKSADPNADNKPGETVAEVVKKVVDAVNVPVKWRHPITGASLVVGRSTLERWYYQAKHAQAGPVDILNRKVRSDHGTHPAVSDPVGECLRQLYRQHPSWSYQLHTDNLAVLVKQKPELGPMPSYASVLRYMKGHGLFKRPRRGPVQSPGAQAAEARYEAREVRSFESEYTNALWHLGFPSWFLARAPARRPMGLPHRAGHLG